MIRKGIETVVPGASLALGGVEAGVSILKFPFKHPYGTVGMCLVGSIALGMTQGYFDKSFSFKTEVVTTAEDQGRGKIVAIDLKIPEHPIVGFTAEVAGAKTVLNKEFNAKIFGFDMPSIPAGTNWVTLSDTVKTVINHDPSSITAVYDPGIISDPEDDRIILTVPLDGFSVENHVEPNTTRYDVHGNVLNYPANFVTALTRSFDGLKSVPGVSTIDAANSEIEQTLVGVTEVSNLNNVAKECTPMVTSDPVVYQAMHENVKNLAPIALRDATDPTIEEIKDTMTVSQFEDIEVVVRIGDETDEKPFLPNQTLNLQNPYAETIEEYSKNPDIKFETQGSFECEISDEVKAMLNETGVPPQATPSATTEASNE